MRKFTFILAVLTIALNVFAASGPDIDPEFKEYVKDFEQYFKKVTVDIKFGHQIPGEAAACYYPKQETRYIYVSRDTWRELNDDQRSQLIWHELGHCVLGLDHDNMFTTIKGNRVPRSIMHSRVFGDYFADIFVKNKTYYIEELMTKVRNTKQTIFDR